MSDPKSGPNASSLPPLRLKASDRLAETTRQGDRQELRDTTQRTNEDASETFARDREFFKLKDELTQKNRRIEALTNQVNRLDASLRRQQGELQAWRYGAGALGVAGLLGAWLLLRRQRVSAPAQDSSPSDSNFSREAEYAEPDSLTVADLAGPADPFDQTADQFDVASLYEAPLDLDDDLLRDSQPGLDVQAANRLGTATGFSGSSIASDSSSSSAPVESASTVDRTSTHSPRKRLFGSTADAPATTSAEHANTSSTSGPTTVSPSGLTAGQLPDLSRVPQPMQELLALNRALSEWRASRQWPVAEQALLHHIRTYPDTAAWVYMELFQLYRAMDKRSEFEEWSLRYRKQFNRLAPTWQESVTEGKGLMRYDLALSQLTQAWAQGRTMWLLEQWFVGENFMRRLMDPGACREVLFLYELCLTLGEMARESRGGVSTPKNT